MRISLVLAALLALGGCAAMKSFDSDVSSYSRWPAERKPTTYAFERLPSQQARPEQQQLLEDAARPAVEAAGFAPSSDPQSADVTVQLGARITATDRSPFDDPFWWGPGLRRPFFYPYHARGFWGPRWPYGWGPRWRDYDYEREVALLIRDRKTGQPLYEARANSDGLTPMVETALPAMFAAALKDFPNGGVNPRRVTVELKPAS
ncbi:MAG: DUF4136 domain-containing protein [Caldimonas sp.]